MRKILILLSVIFSITVKLYAQNPKIDSILILLKTYREDTNRITSLNALSNQLLTNMQYNEALIRAKEALALAKKLRFQKGEGYSLVMEGYCYDALSYYDSAITCYHYALDVFAACNEKGRSGKVNLAIANAYSFMGNINKALEFYIYAYKNNEVRGDSMEMAGSLMGIGNCYLEINKYQSALDNYNKAYAIYARYKNVKIQSWLLSNIAGVYKAMNKTDLALTYFFKAVEAKKQAGENDFSLSTTYAGISGIYLQNKNYNEALKYALMALEIRKKVDDMHELASSYENVAQAYTGTKNYIKAKELFAEAIHLAQKSNSLDIQQVAFRGMANTLYEMGNTKEAYEYRLLYESVKDSVLNNESNRQLNQLTTLYETEKKEQQIKLLNKDKVVQVAELNKQKIIIWSVVIGLCMMFALVLIVVRSLRINQKKNRIIQIQKEMVEEKQKEILDSIRYAKRIQTALITSEKYIANSLNRLMKGN
jgi:tetratricopeptide (TPR) repeat protein